LLSLDERSVLCRLAVFQGGFEREAAEQVAGATLPLLLTLISKSLLRRAQSGRYDLHELIRQYSWERLQEMGEEEATRQRHACFFLTLVQTAESQMYTKQASIWLNRLEQEIDNLRGGLAWALEPAEGDLASQRITTGLRLTSAMFDFWFLRGYHHEGLARYKELLARPEAAAPTQARMKALIGAGYLLWSQGRLAEASPVLEEALTIGKQVEDRKCLALALENLGRVTGSQGDYASAQALLQQSLAIWSELKAGFQVASVLSELGDIALLQQEYEQAEQFYARGITANVANDESQHAYPLRRLAYLVLRRGDCAQAVRLCQESLELNMNIYDRRGMAACLIALASTARMQGQLIQAAKLFGAAEAILVSIAAPLLPADQREYDHNVAALAKQLDAAELAAAWAEGQAMSIDQTIAYALAPTKLNP
jgi:non-specific serine/threonine protein kinase